MRALLCLGVLVMACSSTAEFQSGAGGGAGGEPSGGDAAGMAGRPLAGAASGAASTVEGGSTSAGAGTKGGVSVAGAGQSGLAGAAAGAGQSGAAQGGSGVVAAAGAGGEPTSGAGGAGAGAAGDSAGELGGAGGGGGDGATAPACVCSSGPCCDGCQYLPASHFCGEVIRSSQCLSDGSIDHDYWNLFCSGTDAGACTRWGAHTKFFGYQCGAGLVCSGPAGAASCEPG